MISSCHFDFRFCIDFQCLAGIFASGGWVGKHLSLGVAGVFFAFSQCFRVFQSFAPGGWLGGHFSLGVAGVSIVSPGFPLLSKFSDAARMPCNLGAPGPQTR